MKEQCSYPPYYRFTWPGKDEDFVCVIHAMRGNQIARAMGLHVQFIELEPDEMHQHQCCQEVNK